MEQNLHAMTACIDVNWSWANTVEVTIAPFVHSNYLIVVVEAFNNGQLVMQFTKAVDESTAMINKIRQAHLLFDNPAVELDEREQMIYSLLVANAETLAGVAEQALAQAVLAGD